MLTILGCQVNQVPMMLFGVDAVWCRSQFLWQYTLFLSPKTIKIISLSKIQQQWERKGWQGQRSANFRTAYYTHGEKGIYTDCWNRDKNIYYFRFFQSCFFTIVGNKKNPQMGRMDYLESYIPSKQHKNINTKHISPNAILYYHTDTISSLNSNCFVWGTVKICMVSIFCGCVFIKLYIEW